MKQQYYSLKQNKKGPIYDLGGNLEPADIGWRWCKDGLPTETGDYRVVINRKGKMVTRWALFLGLTKYCGNQNWEVLNDRNWDVVQWCKLPEPLKENNA